MDDRTRIALKTTLQEAAKGLAMTGVGALTTATIPGVGQTIGPLLTGYGIYDTAVAPVSGALEYMSYEKPQVRPATQYNPHINYAAAGAAGLAGLIGANALLPRMRKNKKLRTLLNLTSAAGLGYLGYRLAANQQKNTIAKTGSAMNYTNVCNLMKSAGLFDRERKIIDAYNKAPTVGTAGGYLAGIPAGLLLGGVTYGGLSLIPGIKKQRMLKLLAAILAGSYGGYQIGSNAATAARDNYFESQTGMRSPWKESLNPIFSGQHVVPGDIIDDLRNNWKNVKSDFNNSLSANIDRATEERLARDAQTKVASFIQANNMKRLQRELFALVKQLRNKGSELLKQTKQDAEA